MALQITTLEDARAAAAGGWYTAPVRLYVDANDEVVLAGDPSAVKLLCAQGSRMPKAEAERYGLLKAKAKAPKPAPAPTSPEASTAASDAPEGQTTAPVGPTDEEKAKETQAEADKARKQAPQTKNRGRGRRR